ncbi:MAG TPA: tRNA lysidine(34) synthetase TilS [Bacteroidota bacterium]|nr:tRNA lysidine(34) synthetase TilS [Bacteroidota bacterium]
MPVEYLIRAFREFNRQHRLIDRGDKVIISVSGGVDSMVLLDILVKVSKERKLELAIAHFNHKLREKESDEDESFVRSAAKALRLECYVERANTESISESQKLSLQETARELRYHFFNKLRSSLGFKKIATAHHANDNAETILFNFLRGSGVHGLTGIPPFRSDMLIIRPLLFATRDQIQEYAVKNKISYREDSSNTQSYYTRNFLRNEVIPSIQANINPNIIGTLNRTTETFGELEKYVQNETENFLPSITIRQSEKEIILDKQGFHSKPVLIQEYVLLRLAKDFMKSEVDFNTVKSMLKTTNSETGAYCTLARDIVFYRNRDTIEFRRALPKISYRYQVELNKTYNFDQFRFSSSIVQDATFSKNPLIEYIDADSAGKKIIIRSWNEGDSFIPIGMRNKKKVSDFFIDEKIPLFDKQLIPIVESDEKIIWICGLRLDDRCKVTKKTKTIVKLEYTPRERL